MLKLKYREGRRYKQQKSTANRSGTKRKKNVHKNQYQPEPPTMIMAAGTGRTRWERTW